MMILWCIAIAASMIAHLIADHRKHWPAIYFFKPLTTGLIIGFALVGWHSNPQPYDSWIVAGLILSLLGDVLLMLKNRQFVAGLIAFLLAHIAYVLAFMQALDGWNWPSGAWTAVVVALVYLAMLWPSLGRLRVAVAFYFIAILAMLSQAIALHTELQSTHSLSLLIGACLFALSDGLIAWNKFKQAIARAQVWIMTSYVAAQVLLAWSTHWMN